ncbi:hypothetical protein BJX61DRAFT_544169 [Aspergillus egyptiacus]|nr:hypothetical protein BJX61DRAFT_544169 [Aspergillus egyptiacus]
MVLVVCPTEPREGSRVEESPTSGLARANTSSQQQTDGVSKVRSSTESRKKSMSPESEVDTGPEGNYRKERLGKTLEELKLHCLRTRPISQATWFLYGSIKQDSETAQVSSSTSSTGACPWTMQIATPLRLQGHSV